MNEAEYLKSEEENIRKIARKRIAEIESILGKGRRIRVLDLGSNWGFYLDEFRKMGWHALGIERNLEYSPSGFGSIFSINAINVFWGDVLDFPFDKFQESSYYDVITAFCFLEHLDKTTFYAILHNVIRILKKGGLLVIKSPYCKGLTGRFAPKKYYLDPTHKIELGASDLWIRLLEKYNIKLIKTVVEGSHPERVFPNLGKLKAMKWLTERLGLGDARCWFFMQEY